MPVYVITHPLAALLGLAAYARTPALFGVETTGRRWHDEAAQPRRPVRFSGRPQGFLLRPGPAGKPVSTCGRIALRQAGHCGRNKRLELERRQETQETGRAGRGRGGAAPHSRRKRPRVSLALCACRGLPASPWPGPPRLPPGSCADVINELSIDGARDLIGLDLRPRSSRPLSCAASPVTARRWPGKIGNNLVARYQRRLSTI